MEKVKFVYIGKDNESRIPKDTFKAIKLTTRDKRKMHPEWELGEAKKTEIIVPDTNGYSNGEVFVYGLGWKKMTEKNTIEVPVFSGYVEDWDNYLKQYGKECLFYSISGYDLNSMDCCAYNVRREFHSLLQCDGGIEKYQTYVNTILKIREIQKQKIEETFSPFVSDWFVKDLTKKLLFNPSFGIMFLIFEPYLDTIEDDGKLETFYRKKRYYELRGKYESVVEIDDIITKEMDEEDGVFPVCMSNRMSVIYGDECNRLYDYILQNFKC